MTKIIGLTGGIGSGKTTVAKYFLSKEIPVFIADDQARMLLQKSEIITVIKKEFGDSVFENENLDRQKLAQVVFPNPEKLRVLNSIIHPAVKQVFEEWLEHHSAAPIVVYEAAILFESGSYKFCDYIITITAPLEVRISRVLERDNSTREQVLQRINAQWSDAQRHELSDFVIENTDWETTQKEIDEILKILNIHQN